MKINGEYTVNAPRERVWDALLDPVTLAKTLPGCEELTPVGPDEYEMKMKLALASVSGLFSGKVKLADQNPKESYSLQLSGKGKIGFVKGGGRFTLEDAGSGATKIRYEGDVQAGGMIAGVGQRLMDMTSRMMIKRFFASLEAELAGG